MNDADQFLGRDELAGVDWDLTHVYSSQAGEAVPEITEMGDPCHNPYTIDRLFSCVFLYI
jgi:hypothetical protein